MTVLCKSEAGLTVDANAIYVLNAKSQGSTTWSDLTGKPGSSQFPDVGPYVDGQECSWPMSTTVLEMVLGGASLHHIHCKVQVPCSYSDQGL